MSTIRRPPVRAFCRSSPRKPGAIAARAVLAAALAAAGCNRAADVPPPSAAPPAVAATAGQDAAAAPRFDSARAWADLEAQVAFGPRPSGSPALERTRNYILAELKKAGIDARPQPFTAATPLGEVAMANVVATIPGRRPERIALASHFDTKLYRDIRFVGASDGASSTAALLELGRALTGRSNPFTIELLFFDGEEAVVEWRDNDRTYGSRHYVEAARRNGSLAGLRALVLLDMIGDRNLTIRRDSNSTPWLVDVIWNTAARLGHRGVFLNELTTIEDDHLPFLGAGVPAVDIIDLDYPPWHTADDTVDKLSARSLQIVGDVVLAALPEIEARIR